jgi:hypothetical protein
MSAFLPFTTIERTSLEVRFVPIAEVVTFLFKRSSSARARRDGEISTPSDFAVLRLRASGCNDKRLDLCDLTPSP